MILVIRDTYGDWAISIICISFIPEVNGLLCTQVHAPSAAYITACLLGLSDRAIICAHSDIRKNANHLLCSYYYVALLYFVLFAPSIWTLVFIFAASYKSFRIKRGLLYHVPDGKRYDSGSEMTSFFSTA